VNTYLTAWHVKFDVTLTTAKDSNDFPFYNKSSKLLQVITWSLYVCHLACLPVKNKRISSVLKVEYTSCKQISCVAFLNGFLY